MNRIRTLIKSARVFQGRSLVDLAQFLDVTERALQDFEIGAASIEAETLFGLVNALNIDPEEFLNLLQVDEVDDARDSAVELLSLRIRSKLRG